MFLTQIVPMYASSSPALVLVFSLLQHVLGCVKMEGHAVNQPVHVTVQIATVGTTVKVSAYLAQS